MVRYTTFFSGKARALYVAGDAVDAVFAIKHTIVSEQYFQQRDAPPVRRIGMANAHALCTANPFAFALGF